MRILPCLAALGLVAACGNTPADRALSGAGIGAGVGTVGAILIDGNPITGAAIGAAAGAITGASTSKDKLNMGDPIWK